MVRKLLIKAPRNDLLRADFESNVERFELQQSKMNAKAFKKEFYTILLEEIMIISSDKEEGG